MPKYRKLPVVIEAVQMEEAFDVDTKEGLMHGHPGWWLITGIQGEQYPCEDAIFRATYEAVDEEGELMLAADTTRKYV